MLERLTDEECLSIMNKLLGVHYNKAFAQFIINESKLIRSNGVTRLSFPCLDLCNGPRPNTQGTRMEDRCQLTDFSARILISGGQAVYKNEVNTLFRTEMFKKFGNDYLQLLETHLKECALSKYKKTLNNIDTELYNIQGGRMPMAHEFLEP